MFKGWWLQKQVSQSYGSWVCELYHVGIQLYEVSKKYLEQFLSCRVDQLYYRNHFFRNSKDHNSKSGLTWITVLVLCTLFYDALHLYEVSSNYLERTELTRVPRRKCYFQYLLCSKGRTSKSKLTKVTVFVFCSLSHRSLHLWEVSSKYLGRFSTYTADTNTW